jgi:hypothetical protein
LYDASDTLWATFEQNFQTEMLNKVLTDWNIFDISVWISGQKYGTFDANLNERRFSDRLRQTWVLAKFNKTGPWMSEKLRWLLRMGCSL